MKLVLCSSFIIWFLPVFAHANTEENEVKKVETAALVFDRFSGNLYLLPQEIPKNLECGAWAVACPAETPAETDFIKENAFTSNALFVKEICNRGNKFSQMKTKSCKKPYQISLSYKVKNNSFQFGYEIYYDLGDEKYFHKDTVYEDYRGIDEIMKVMKTIIKKAVYYFKETYRILKTALNLDIKEMWLNRDKRMGFVWVYLFKIRFDFTKKTLIRVWYEIEENNRWTVGEQCENYSLGFEAYDGTNVDGLYTKQQELFKAAKQPANQSGSLSQNQQQELLKATKQPANQKGLNNIRLVKWLLIPIDQFRFGSTKPICSNIATIPIWIDKVESVMKKVDTFLYSLFVVIKEPLQIVSGTTGEFKIGFAKTLYLDPISKQVPVPKIIYKIVEYQAQGCKEEEMLCWYSAIIVVHNDPNFKKKDKVCKDVTTTWGWEELTLDYDFGEHSDLVYVCENNVSMQKKLSTGAREGVAGGMNLIKFPFFNKETMKMDEKGRYIKDDVNQTFKTFQQQGPTNPNLQSKKVIERGHTESLITDPDVENVVQESEGATLKQGDR